MNECKGVNDVLRELRFNCTDSLVRTDFVLRIADFVLWRFHYRCELGLTFLKNVLFIHFDSCVYADSPKFY